MKILIILPLFFLRGASISFCDSSLSSKFFRIIGGESLESRRFPWQAVLLAYDANGKAMMCGGTVLDDHWILTAAHCVSGALQSVYILTGVDTLQNPKWVTKATVLFVHPDYDPVTINNDIALVKSAKKLINSIVKPVCLTRDDYVFLKPGTVSIITGFGLRLINSIESVLTLSNTVMATEVPIISHTSCLLSWNSATEGAIQITNNEICAGSLFHGTSPGDSGGPLLVIDELGRDVQIGITSFGAAGMRGLIDQNTFPGVYTRVSHYIPWIESVTASSREERNGFSSIYLYLFIVFLSLFY